jgi:hypothetical protein
MLLEGLEPTILVSELSQTIVVLECATRVVGLWGIILQLFYRLE